MAFTTISEGDFLDDTTLWTVVEELKTAVDERNQFISATPISWATSMYRDARGGDAIDIIRGWIQNAALYFVKTGEQFITYGGTSDAGGNDGTALSTLLTEAGWGTAWVSNDSVNPSHAWHVSDSRIWRQMQDAIQLLTVYKTVLPKNSTYESWYRVSTTGDAATTQAAAWTAMLSKTGALQSGQPLAMWSSRRISASPDRYIAAGATDFVCGIQNNGLPALALALPISRLKTTSLPIRSDADLASYVEATDVFGRVFKIENGTNAGSLKVTVSDGTEADQVFDNRAYDFFPPEEADYVRAVHVPSGTLTLNDIIASGLTLDWTLPLAHPFTGLSASVEGSVYIDFSGWVSGSGTTLVAAHDISSLLTYG